MTLIAIDDIRIGDRIREDKGDIAGMAASLSKHGLIEPVVIAGEDNALICGERRLRAAQALGWEDIEAEVRWGLPPGERLELEFEENLQRKDLTAYEASKRLIAKVREIAPRLRSGSERKGSRPGARSHEAPLKDIGQALGQSAAAIVNAEQHVAAVEAYPELEPLPQQTAIETAKTLRALPESDREAERDRIKSEAEEGARILDIVGDPQGAIGRAALRARFSKLRSVVVNQLLGLDVEELASVLTVADWDSVYWFVHDTHRWLESLENARPAGLSIVGGTSS